jgi:E3 ubiquitin-protein ligase HERC3
MRSLKPLLTLFGLSCVLAMAACGSSGAAAESQGPGGAGGDVPDGAVVPGDGGPGSTPDGGDGSPKDDGGLSTVTPSAFATGGVFSCAIVSAGKVKCWGSAGNAGFGLGNLQSLGDQPGEMGAALPYVQLGTSRTAKALAVGSFHACAILDDDTIKCWGLNDHGQLGLGDNTRRGDRASDNDMGDALPAVSLGTGLKPLAIAAGGDRTCVLVTGGRVKCWGRNAAGDLATGDLLPRGTSPAHMGDGLAFIPLGTGAVVRSMALGWNHTCVLLDIGVVKCWGKNTSNNRGGQLGLGDTVARIAPDQMGDVLPAVSLGVGRTARAVAVSDTHSCALLDDDTVKCWGDNSFGALGVGDGDARGDKPNTMGDSLPRWNLGTSRRAKAIAVGQGFSCALLDNGSVKCVGLNGDGQLGLGDVVDRGETASSIGDGLPAIALGTGRTATAIWAANRTVCARLDDGALKCWGSNPGGVLGTGDPMKRGDKPGQMGDALPALQLL